MYRFSILLQKIKMNNLLLPRHYSIQPPVWMGGKVRRKFKGKPYEIPNSFADKIAGKRLRNRHQMKWAIIEVVVWIGPARHNYLFPLLDVL